MTDFSRLLDSGRLARVAKSPSQARTLLKVARRDLEVAGALVGTSPDWVLGISYNAMLQAGRALMAAKGYKTARDSHHVTVVRFLEIALGSRHDNDLLVLDRMRRQRHRSVYG